MRHEIVETRWNDGTQYCAVCGDELYRQEYEHQDYCTPEDDEE